METICQKSYRVLKSNGRMLETTLTYFIVFPSINLVTWAKNRVLASFLCADPNRRSLSCPIRFQHSECPSSHSFCLPYNLPPSFVFLWLPSISSSASSNSTSDMWQDSQAQGPWPIFYLMFLSFFLSAPLPAAFWLLKTELSCQSSAWPPEGSLWPSNLRKVKIKQNKKKKNL